MRPSSALVRVAVCAAMIGAGMTASSAAAAESGSPGATLEAVSRSGEVTTVATASPTVSHSGSATPVVSRLTGTGVAVSPPYAPTPPHGIRCSVVAKGTVTYLCVLGRSWGGRAIVAERQGNPASHRVLVVNGQMHGEEWPGLLSVDTIRRTPIPSTASIQVWTVRTINPDGGAIGRRWNNHGVDLNRNFANKFVVMSRSGPHALSEPESISMTRFLAWVQPDLLVSLHGYSQAVDTTGGGRRAALARRFSALSRIVPAHAVPCGGPCHGNMTDWYSAGSRVGGVGFTVEMPHSSRVVRACAVPGRPSRATPIQCVAWAAIFMARSLPA